MNELSNFAKDSIRQILNESDKVLAGDLDDVVWSIEVTCSMALGAEDTGEPSAIKKEIAALETVLMRTVEKIKGLSLYSRLALEDITDDGEEIKDKDLTRRSKSESRNDLD